MGHTWGISGPQFLVLYAAVLVLAVAAAIAIRRGAARGTVLRLAEPDTLLIAYLTAGAPRVLQSILVRLRLLELAGPTADPTVWQATHGVPSVPLDPATDAVLRAVAARTPIAHLARVPQVRAVVDDLHAQAVAAGAVLPDQVRRQLRETAVLPAAVVVLGIARLVAGVSAHRPVGFLVVELLVALVATGLTLVVRRSHPGLPARIKALRASRTTRAGRLGPVEAAVLAVALLGAKAFDVEPLLGPHKGLWAGLKTGMGKRPGGDDPGVVWFGGVDSSDSSGDGSGGGGGGGGGCGGCGG